MAATPEFRKMPESDRRALLKKLTPSMAKFFVGKYRDLTPPDTNLGTAMELAVSCGGPDAAAFVEELIQLRAEGRAGIEVGVLPNVLSDGNFGLRPREFPVHESLMNRTRLLLMASNILDRELAIRILGHAPRDVAAPLLMGVAGSDEDQYMRQAAVRELGRNGDAASLEFLKTHRNTLPGTRDRAIFLRIIDDAIEELEERLQ